MSDVSAATSDDRRRREHLLGADCWCEPVLEHTTSGGGHVWVHLEGDGEHPPPVVIAEAIRQVCKDEAEEAEDDGAIV